MDEYKVVTAEFQKGLSGKARNYEASVMLGARCVYSYTEDWEDFSTYEAETVADTLNEETSDLRKQLEKSQAALQDFEIFVKKVEAHVEGDAIDFANAAIDWQREARELLGIEAKSSEDEIPF